MARLRLIGIAVGSFVAAALCIGLVDPIIPRILGAATGFIVTIVLGWLIFRDIVRRDRPTDPG
jgi:hypothetical protein